MPFLLQQGLRAVCRVSNLRSLIEIRISSFARSTAKTTASICTSRAHSQSDSTGSDSRQANWKARVELAASYRACEMLGLSEGVCNHLSIMAPARSGNGDVMLLVPYGLHWREVTASCLIGLNEAGEVTEGKGYAEIAAASIHLGIHKARPDATCVFHLHPPYATAIGCLQDHAFGMYHQNACRFLGVFAYDRDYTGLAKAEEEGRRLAKQFGKGRVLFMCSHGVTVVGPNAAQTFDDCYYLERACMTQMLAMQSGRELHELPKDVCRKVKDDYDKQIDQLSSAHFNAMKRILADEKPNFAS